MSQANVEIVRAVYEAWNAGSTDALRELIHPDIVMRSPKDWPEPGPFVGRDSVMRAVEQLPEPFDSDWQELVSDILDSGDRAVVRTVWHGVGRGPEMKQESTVVSPFAIGKSFRSSFSPITRRLSKPWGCRSRRCQLRTWRSCGG
jgi:ketosteroid isomerase-like protein